MENKSPLNSYNIIDLDHKKIKRFGGMKLWSYF